MKRDVSSFAFLANWLIRVNKKFDIVSNLNFDEIWADREEWEFDEFVQLMYEFYSLSKESYLDFVAKNKSEILSYLRVRTDTLKIYEDHDKIYINYVLLPQNTQKANEESVRRINSVCKFLPIYSTYFTDSIKPQIDLTKDFIFLDQSHKEMPISNIRMSFNTDLNELWSKSILFHYEFDSIYDWQNYWMNLRKKVVEFFKVNIEVLEKILKQQKQDQSTIILLDKFGSYIVNSIKCENLFPYQKRPFEELSKANEFISKIKKGYFSSIRNYINQFTNIIQKNQENNLCNLAIISLKDSRNQLDDMQKCFNKISKYTVKYFDVSDLENEEKLWVDRLIDLNEYYLNNVPNKEEFSRYEVVRWKQEKEQAFLKLINEKINEAEEYSGFTLIKPTKVLYEGNLTTVPIGVINLNLTNEKEIAFLFVSLIPFTEINVNYILFVILDNQLQVLPNGIRININLLKKMQDCIENDKEFSMGMMTTPLPYEITKEHLSCFQEHIELINTQETDFENIDIFLLSLWEYSLYQSYLNISENEEKIYLTDKLKKMAMKTEKIFKSIKDKIPICFMDRIVALKNRVLEKQMTFEDKDLNKWLNEIILYINNN